MPATQGGKKKVNKYLSRKDGAPCPVCYHPKLTAIQWSQKNNNSQKVINQCPFPPHPHMQMRNDVQSPVVTVSESQASICLQNSFFFHCHLPTLFKAFWRFGLWYLSLHHCLHEWCAVCICAMLKESRPRGWRGFKGACTLPRKPCPHPGVYLSFWLLV